MSPIDSGLGINECSLMEMAVGVDDEWCDFDGSLVDYNWIISIVV